MSIIPRFSTTGVSALLCGAAAPCLYEFIAGYKTEKSYFLWVLLFSPQKNTPVVYTADCFESI